MSDSTVAAMGSATNRSARALESFESPAPSFPTTMANCSGGVEPDDRVARGVGGPDIDRPFAPERVELVPGTTEAGMMEVRPHRATDDFGVP